MLFIQCRFVDIRVTLLINLIKSTLINFTLLDNFDTNRHETTKPRHNDNYDEPLATRTSFGEFGQRLSACLSVQQQLMLVSLLSALVTFLWFTFLLLSFYFTLYSLLANFHYLSFPCFLFTLCSPLFLYFPVSSLNSNWFYVVYCLFPFLYVFTSFCL